MKQNSRRGRVEATSPLELLTETVCHQSQAHFVRLSLLTLFLFPEQAGVQDGWPSRSTVGSWSVCRSRAVQVFACADPSPERRKSISARRSAGSTADLNPFKSRDGSLFFCFTSFFLLICRIFDLTGDTQMRQLCDP